MPASRAHLDAYVKDEMRPVLERLGFKVQILPNPVEGVGPVLLAERFEGADLPTVLSYGHGDVIRGLDDQWRAGIEPWVLKQGRRPLLRSGHRGQQGPALGESRGARGSAGRAWPPRLQLSLPAGDGEELSSPGLRAFCESNREKLRADVFIASDGPRLSAKRPTIYLGSRGSLNLLFKCVLREGAHHSGNWGGLLANPGVILAHALSSIVTREGRVLVC